MPYRTPEIIGLCGLAGAGKTTVATALESVSKYTRTSLAAPIKEMLSALVGEPIERYRKDADLPFVEGETIRHALQTLGTEWGRQHMGVDFWINVWESRHWHYPATVIDDVRFENEARYIRDRGGLVFEIIRPGVERRYDHASEDRGFDADFEILNNSTPEQAASEIMGWVKRWTKST